MDTPSRPSFIERLTSLLLREPEDREQLLEILHSAYERNLMDADALTIIEGALGRLRHPRYRCDDSRGRK
jgi:magnesium and cobalt transporter